MKISLLGVKWDKYQSFRGGSARGVDILRKWFLSDNIELNLANGNMYDTEIEDLGDIEPQDSDHIVPMCADILSKATGFPVILGGSHAITLGPVKAVKPENFVVFDAHSDLYSKDHHDPTWMKHEQGKLSQENVTWHVHQEGIPIHLFGIRVFSPEEEKYMQEKGLKVSTIDDLRNIKGNIYLSIDLDCLDPTIMLAVGNHEPNGMTFAEVIEAVRAIADRVIAVDFVEFTPFPEDATGKELNKIYARVVSKLIWSVLAEIRKAQKNA